jgi:F0F1-type ATP synthase membrane subunit b/b'
MTPQSGGTSAGPSICPKEASVMAKNSEVPAFVKEQLAEAQKRFAAIQVQAEKTIKEWVVKGQEIQATTAKRTKKLGSEVRKQAETFQNRVIQAAGVATQSQIKALTRELSKLAKKVDTLVEKKSASKSDVRA